MQWIILTPLALLFGFIVVRAAITGLRGARLLSTTEKVGLPPASQREASVSHTTAAPRVLPGRGWVIALGLVLIYFLLPFIAAPLLGLLMGE